jgi:exodeoxyribonuclease-5
MSFVPSPLQAKAIRDIKEWFTTRTATQKVFRVFGYAGTGKSTIVKHAIAELGLNEGEVLYAAFTGKATLVMTRKGTKASTIHSLIYRVSEATKAEIERVREEIANLKAQIPNMPPETKLFEESRLRALELRLEDIHKPRFILNDQSILRDAKLLVLDEVSMVGNDMARNLLAFGRPILVLGDPGQLPPISGDGAFTNVEPDVMLTEIHRQAGESAIVRLATMARQGDRIPYGQHDEFVWKMRRADVAPPQMLNGGQVICGRNATRLWLNSAMKEAAGFPGIYPSGNGEKIICLKNRADAGFVNGMFLTLTDVKDSDKHSFTAVIIPEDGAITDDGSGKPTRHYIYKGFFEEHVTQDPDRLKRDHWVRKDLIEAVWGYAITCHKAQGSQWENVIVYDDGLCREESDRRCWLYTAITRAEKGLVILD